MINVLTNCMRKNYFFATSLLMLLVSLVAFSDNLITDVGQKSNSDPKFIIHGLFCFAWFLIVVIQTGFIRSNNYKAHMRLGIAGIIAALGVFVSTVYIFVVIYKGLDAMSPVVKANRIMMLSFALFVWLGYRHKKNAVWHKRLMYVATLYMFGFPVLDRFAGRMHIDNVELFTIIVPCLLFLSLFIYDWIALKKLHPISWLAFGWLLCIWAFAIFS
jgi:hypothetical protein